MCATHIELGDEVVVLHLSHLATVIQKLNLSLAQQQMKEEQMKTLAFENRELAIERKEIAIHRKEMEINIINRGKYGYDSNAERRPVKESSKSEWL